MSNHIYVIVHDVGLDGVEVEKQSFSTKEEARAALIDQKAKNRHAGGCEGCSIHKIELPTHTKVDPVLEAKQIMAQHMRHDHRMTIAEISHAVDIDFFDLRILFDMPRNYTNFDELRTPRK